MSSQSFDKLKDAHSPYVGSPEFDFKCVDCKSMNLKVKPYGVRYKPDRIDNSDIKNQKLKEYYDSAIPFRKAIEMSINNGNLRFDCVDCKRVFALPKEHDKEKLKNFLYGRSVTSG